MRFLLFLEKHGMVDESTNRLYKPFHFLIVVFGSVNTQGPTHRAHLTLFETYLSEVDVPLQGLFTRPASWGTITFGLVEDFVEWQLRKGYAIKSINERLSTVKRYASLACKAGGLAAEELFLIRKVKGFRH